MKKKCYTIKNYDSKKKALKQKELEKRMNEKEKKLVPEVQLCHQQCKPAYDVMIDVNDIIKSGVTFSLLVLSDDVIKTCEDLPHDLK